MINKTKILLHICCAPCLIYPLRKLQSDNYEVSGFFYNPNIYPVEEYNLRKNTLIDYSGQTGLTVQFFAEYDDKNFFNSLGESKLKPERCEICWYLRLKKTAEQAKILNLDMFTTTLLVSPYQDTYSIKRIGEKIAEQTNCKFYFDDFQQGYKDCVRISREKKMYRQKYCGCIFSLQEANKS